MYNFTVLSLTVSLPEVPGEELGQQCEFFCTAACGKVAGAAGTAWCGAGMSDGNEC